MVASERDDQAGGAPVASDADWPAQVRSSGVRLRPLTALCAVALIATLAVWGGAELEKRERGSSAAAATGFPSAALRARFASGAGGATGFGRAAGAAAATGIVTEVAGNILYLTSSSGALVKVKLTSATTYTRTAKSPQGGLTQGDTAIVQGQKNAAGVVVATSVLATAKGVTSLAASFGAPGG
jgi:hypothetical protein